MGLAWKQQVLWTYITSIYILAWLMWMYFQWKSHGKTNTDSQPEQKKKGKYLFSEPQSLLTAAGSENI